MRPKFRSYFQNIIDIIYSQRNEIKKFISKNLKKNTKKTLKKYLRKNIKSVKNKK